MPRKKATSEPMNLAERAEQQVRHSYGLAVRFLDEGEITTIEQVVDDLLNDTEGAPAGVLEAFCGFLGRLRDALDIRGWGPKPAMQLEFPGNVVDWGPKISKEGQRLRITFEADRIEPAELGMLWIAHADRCRATFRFGARQLELGAAPPPQDLAQLMEQHDAGEHTMKPDYACPACLAYAAEERLRPPEPEGAEGEAPGEAEEPLAEGEDPSEPEQPPAEPVE